MSAYDFIAANKKLSPLDIGIEDKGYVILIENEDSILSIYEDESSCYTKPFTELPIIMAVQLGRDFSSFEAELNDYLTEAMKENDAIELWATRIGEVSGIEKRTLHIDELVIEDLRWVFGDHEYSHPKGLRLYKWTRGKK